MFIGEDSSCRNWTDRVEADDCRECLSLPYRLNRVEISGLFSRSRACYQFSAPRLVQPCDLITRLTCWLLCNRGQVLFVGLSQIGKAQHALRKVSTPAFRRFDAF